jgi:hypothetical protein
VTETPGWRAARGHVRPPGLFSRRGADRRRSACISRTRPSSTGAGRRNPRRALPREQVAFDSSGGRLRAGVAKVTSLLLRPHIPSFPSKTSTPPVRSLSCKGLADPRVPPPDATWSLFPTASDRRFAPAPAPGVCTALDCPRPTSPARQPGSRLSLTPIRAFVPAASHDSCVAATRFASRGCPASANAWAAVVSSTCAPVASPCAAARCARTSL